jgi:rubrerythrin
MSEGSTQDQPINSMGVLLAHALAMENDAADRYGELADQMEMHRKKGVASIFRRLEKAEKKHLAELEELTAEMDLPHISPMGFQVGRRKPRSHRRRPRQLQHERQGRRAAGPAP